MNSRSILIAAGFSLACTILLGSALLQLAVGSGPPPSLAPDGPPLSDTTPGDSDRSEPAVQGIEPKPGQEVARRLEELLTKAEVVIAARQRASATSLPPDPGSGFEGVGSGGGMDAEVAALAVRQATPLPDEAILLFAEMVRIIDETSGYRFIIEIADSDLGLARRRSEVFQNALLLALRDPSKLRIEEVAASMPGVRVRAVEASREP